MSEPHHELLSRAAQRSRRKDLRYERRKKFAVNDKYSRRVFSGALAILLALGVRAILMTSDPAARDKAARFRLQEAWSLVVSLRFDDYITAVTGSIITHLPFALYAAFIGSLVILRLETAYILLDDQWYFSPRTGVAAISAIFCCVALAFEGSWWWRLGLSATVITLWMAQRYLYNLPGTINRRMYRAYNRRRQTVELGEPGLLELTWSGLYEVISHRGRFDRDGVLMFWTSRKSFESWANLRHYLRLQEYTPSIKMYDERVAIIEAMTRQACEYDLNYDIALADWKLSDKGVWSHKRHRRVVATALICQRLNYVVAPKLTALFVLAAVVCSASVVFTSEPWVPAECFTLTSESRPVEGFRMSDTGSVLTILLSTSRTIMAVPTRQITKITPDGCLSTTGADAPPSVIPSKPQTHAPADTRISTPSNEMLKSSKVASSPASPGGLATATR